MLFTAWNCSLPVDYRGLPTGEIDWNKSSDVWRAFNWHPILMILFMGFGALAIFCFKMLPGGHFFKKLMHGLFHLFAVASSVAGFAYLVYWKHKSGNEQFWSMHSWLGIALLGLYWLQFVLGFIAFLLPGPLLIAKNIRAWFVIVHRHAGLKIWIGLLIVVLTGFVQRQWFMLMGQGAAAPEFANDRSASYWGLNSISLVSCFLGAFVLLVFRHVKPAQDEHHYSPIQAISYH